MTDRKKIERDTIRLTINDVEQEFEIGDHRYQVAACDTLAKTLRERWGYWEPKPAVIREPVARARSCWMEYRFYPV